MAAIEIGRLCVKIAGRDAGKECLIVDILNKNFVLIDGNTRRKKCNINHLELLPKKADIKKGASHEEVVSALQALGIKIEERKTEQKIEQKVEKKTQSVETVAKAKASTKPTKKTKRKEET